jgi:hypothetical protein
MTLLCRAAYDEDFCLMQFFTLLLIIHNDYDCKPYEYFALQHNIVIVAAAAFIIATFRLTDSDFRVCIILSNYSNGLEFRFVHASVPCII